MKYQPKRSSARWLEGAPACVLACYDAGPKWPNDRFTVLYGAPYWSPDYGRNVPFLACSESGAYYHGEMPASNRSACGRKVRWQDLPDVVKRAVVADTKPESE